MRHWTLSAVIGAATFSSGAGFASPVQGVVSGIYVLDAQRSASAFEAIDSATANVSDDKRPLARKRLRKSIAVNILRISRAGNRLGIAYDAKAPIVVWIAEDPIKWKLAETFVFDVSAKSDGEAISLTFHSDDGERTTTYRSVGQDLVEDTTIISPLSSTPIVYKLVYNRTN